jgi:hypothetical protein
MKIQIESTTKIVEASGVKCRVWEGTTDTGIDVVCLIARIAAPAGEDLSRFEAELLEQSAPTSLAEVFPLRMIL